MKRRGRTTTARSSSKRRTLLRHHRTLLPPFFPFAFYVSLQNCAYCAVSGIRGEHGFIVDIWAGLGLDAISLKTPPSPFFFVLSFSLSSSKSKINLNRWSYLYILGFTLSVTYRHSFHLAFAIN